MNVGMTVVGTTVTDPKVRDGVLNINEMIMNICMMTAWTDPKDSCMEYYVGIFENNEMIMLVMTMCMPGGYDDD